MGTAAESAGVSINSVLQNPITNHNEINFVIATEEVALSQVGEMWNHSYDNTGPTLC